MSPDNAEVAVGESVRYCPREVGSHEGLADLAHLADPAHLADQVVGVLNGDLETAVFREESGVLADRVADVDDR